MVEVRDEIETIWRDTLRQAARERVVCGDLRLLRLSMLGAMNWALKWYRPGGALSVVQLADHLLDIFISDRAERRRRITAPSKKKPG